MEQLPKQLVIIGGGVIASEIASSMANVYKLMNIMKLVTHVYAIGDLVPGYQLAHTASAHGKYVAEYIAGANNQRRLIKRIYQDVFIQDWNLRQ